MAAPRLSPVEMQRLSTLATLIANNPKHRAQFAGMVADVAPGTPESKSFSDIDLQKQFEALSKKIDDQILNTQIKEAQTAQATQRRSLIDSGRYTEDQVKEIESGPMTKFGILDYEAGAALYAHEHPAENPALIPPEVEDTSKTWEFPTVEDRNGKLMSFQDFAKDPVKSSLNAAYRTIAQFKKTRLSPSFSRA
jgi:hypothetical protein